MLTPTSTFTLARPIPTFNAHLSPSEYESALPGRLPRDARDREAHGTMTRVLVVDDAPDVSEMLATILRYSGYEVSTATSATEALDLARREQFDVVVSDIGMPGMNGYQLAEALRAFPAFSSVPLVAVTGFDMYSDREKARAAGFDAFLAKPINPGDLIDTIKSFSGDV